MNVFKNAPIDKLHRRKDHERLAKTLAWPRVAALCALTSAALGEWLRGSNTL